MEEWYYALNGGQQGPVTREQLEQLLTGGTCPWDTLVWRDGMADWVAANTVAEFSAGGMAATPYAAPQPVLGYGVADSVYANPNAASQYAGFWIRFAGAFIDGLVLMVPRVVISVALPALVSSGMAGSSQNAQLVVIAVNTAIGQIIGWLYFALMLSSSKQATLGMMAVGLRITDLQGRRISFARATGRHFASLVSQITLFIGYLFILWTEKKQTLHDLMAGTLVLTK